MKSFLFKKKSNINGYGIFSKRTIKKKEIFYKIPTDNVYHKPRSKCAFIGKNTWINDKKILNYVNNSCNPNTRLIIAKNPVLKSLKKINKYDEITVNYNLTEKRGKKVKCHCKSKNCKNYFLRIE